VLDHIQAWTFLVKPAGKRPGPFATALLDIKLNKSTGIALLLPRRGLFTGAQADDDIADPHCLPWLQGQIARCAIALVEQADHRHALCHRRRTSQNRLVSPNINSDDVGSALGFIQDCV